MGVSIMLGKRSITPGGRSRMASQITDTFGYTHGSAYVFDERDLVALTELARLEGRHPFEEPAEGSTDIGDSFRAIVDEVRANGQAVVRLVY